jgi:hypothetical protein
MVQAKLNGKRKINVLYLEGVNIILLIVFGIEKKKQNNKSLCSQSLKIDYNNLECA